MKDEFSDLSPGQQADMVHVKSITGAAAVLKLLAEKAQAQLDEDGQLRPGSNIIMDDLARALDFLAMGLFRDGENITDDILRARARSHEAESK
jgi:hypothetical protein